MRFSSAMLAAFVSLEGKNGSYSWYKFGMTKKSPPLLQPAEFDRLLRETRMREGSRSTDAARLVLVDGFTQAEAGRQIGLTRAAVSMAVSAIRRRMKVVMIPCPAELETECLAWIRKRQTTKKLAYPVDHSQGGTRPLRL